MKLKLALATAALSLAATSCFAADLANRAGLTLDVAKQLSAAAETEAVKNKWTVAIAIVDEGGHLIHLAKIDNTQYGSIDGAVLKKITCREYRPTHRRRPSPLDRLRWISRRIRRWHRSLFRHA